MGLDLFSREFCLGFIFFLDIDYIWFEFCFILDIGYFCVCDYD